MSILFDIHRDSSDNTFDLARRRLYEDTHNAALWGEDVKMTQDRTFDARTEFFSAAEGMANAESAQSSSYSAHLDADLYAGLATAVLSDDWSSYREVVADAAARGVSKTALADDYIPALARQMGDMWCRDTMGFAEVTIGVARLQAILRDLGPEWRADQSASADAPLILLVTLRDAQHTLGAVLLAGQLRRKGYSVRLALDATQHHLADLCTRLRFDAVFVSASESESLEKLRKMIDFLRETSGTPLNVAVGGGLLDIHDDVASVVGADIATSNIDEAVEHCGLIQPLKNSATNAPET